MIAATLKLLCVSVVPWSARRLHKPLYLQLQATRPNSRARVATTLDVRV
jgi:hypothetical protein